MKKFLIKIVLFVLILCLLTTPCFASSYTISNWDASGETDVWYSSVPINAGVGKYETGFYTATLNAMKSGVSVWNNASFLPFTITYESIHFEYDGANVWYYGGEYSFLRTYFDGLSSTALGYAPIVAPASSDTVTYVSNSIKYTKNVREFDGTERRKVAILNKGTVPATPYTTVGAHEMGHVLGWYGHTATATQLMYSSATATSVQTQDKRHIKQIYDLFY